MPRNLVVLCDGTGNELGRNLSNVLKLYRIARKNTRQLCYYHPGVGTIGRTSPWARFMQRARSLFGLMTGYGLDENVLSAYRFLVENWRPGDRIYLFGFSRGAWTVRVLAGFIHLIGLLKPEQRNLCDSALGTYKRAATEDDLPLAWHFSRVLGVRRPRIHFIGAWDTVASMIVPRPDRFWLPSFETLPYTCRNPSVAVFRHALAIDERRRLFRVAQWQEPQDHLAQPFRRDSRQPQDIQQVWFAGAHSDVGGGYPEAASALSKIPLSWMVEQAEAHGLLIHRHVFRHLAHGKPRKGSQHRYVAPDPCGTLHRSLSGLWWLLELLPRRARHGHRPRWHLAGWHLPLGKPRDIPGCAAIHASAYLRKRAISSYRPTNLPDPTEPSSLT